MCTWPSQGASGADFYSLYFLPQDANVLRTDANPPGARTFVQYSPPFAVTPCRYVDRCSQLHITPSR